MSPKENKVVNTAKEADEKPAKVMAEAMLMGSSGAIEAMEARGTQQLSESSVLPTEGLDPVWAAKVGIKVLGKVDGDPIFSHVDLPAGWHQKTTDHDMHNKLLDDRGRVRASIFYKAAFYDRRADMRPECRYQMRTAYPEETGKGTVATRVVDTAKDNVPIIAFEKQAGEGEAWHASNAARKEAAAYLRDNYAAYEDPAAYW